MNKLPGTCFKFRLKGWGGGGGGGRRGGVTLSEQ